MDLQSLMTRLELINKSITETESNLKALLGHRTEVQYWIEQLPTSQPSECSEVECSNESLNEVVEAEVA